MTSPFNIDDDIPEHITVKEIKEKDAEKTQEREDKVLEVRKEPDLIKRAQRMSQHMIWPVTKGNPPTPVACDENMFVAFDALFGVGRDGERPHYDEFRGSLVDHIGERINPHYPVKSWITTLSKVGLRGYSSDTVRRGLREYALTCKRNDLCEYIESKIPEWDGKPRMETYLWELFRSFDTPFNRLMSRYLWLSFYMRCMHPGSDAPIVISLIGDQMNGKSFFSKRLVQITTGNVELDSVKLDLRDPQKFMRQITGNSNVATIPEMRGYAAADHSRTKEFVTQTADNFDQKFEPNIVQQRQWIILMDSNKWEGVLRDDTGNRRFAPLFVAQLPDENNKPAWEVKHSVDDGVKFNAGPFIASAAFADDVWQLFAEARTWVLENGERGYAEFVAEAATAVQHFSEKEMMRDSGTIVDFVLDTYLDAGLSDVEGTLIEMRLERTMGVFVGTANLIEAMTEAADGKPLQINPWKLKDAMKARGGKEYKRRLSVREGGRVKYKGVVPGFLFQDVESKEALVEKLALRHCGGVGDGPEYGEPDYLPKGDGKF